jgi:hypothetical protein
LILSVAALTEISAIITITRRLIMILALALIIVVLAGLFANDFKSWIALIVLMAVIVAGMAHLGGLI